MVIITDVPARTAEWTASLIGPGSVKTSFPLDPDQAWWWARLGGGATPMGAVAAAPDDLAAWPLVLAVSDAARSQYDVLVESLRDPSAPDRPVAALALAGQGFHGNRGRPWQATAGNLHLCAAWPVDLDAAACAPALPALAAVAAVEALWKTCGPALPVRLKWINDVLLDVGDGAGAKIGGAKVGGVLASARLVGPRITGVVVGIGVNVRVRPAVAPTPFVPAVACLADHAGGQAAVAAPGALVAALLAALARHAAVLAHAGPAALADAYRACCHDAGRLVAVWPEGLPDAPGVDHLPPPLARGRVEAIAPDLSLRIVGHAAPLHGGRMAYLD